MKVISDTIIITLVHKGNIIGNLFDKYCAGYVNCLMLNSFSFFEPM